MGAPKDKPMKDWIVSCEVEVSADSPEEAARLARTRMALLYSDSKITTFKMHEKGEGSCAACIEVDLSMAPGRRVRVLL